MTNNPFLGPRYNGHQLYYLSADERIMKVKDFDVEQCESALLVPGLQKTVDRVIRARLRKLIAAAT